MMPLFFKPFSLTLLGNGHVIWFFSPPDTVRPAMDGASTIVTMSTHEFAVVETVPEVLSKLGV